MCLHDLLEFVYIMFVVAVWYCFAIFRRILRPRCSDKLVNRSFVKAVDTTGKCFLSHVEGAGKQNVVNGNHL